MMVEYVLNSVPSLNANTFATLRIVSDTGYTRINLEDSVLKVFVPAQSNLSFHVPLGSLLCSKSLLLATNASHTESSSAILSPTSDTPDEPENKLSTLSLLRTPFLVLTEPLE